MGMWRDPEPPQGTGERLGKSPASPGLGTLGSHQDKGWAATQWCSSWGEFLEPLHPPATRSPPWGLSPASLTYFGPAGDKGGLCSSAQAEEG